MDLQQALVAVQTASYVGPAIVQALNDDGSVTLLIEELGTVIRVRLDTVTRLPVTEQPAEWIADCLLSAWTPFFRRIATATAQRLLTYGCYGEPEVVEGIFQRYLDAPETLFRELYGR